MVCGPGVLFVNDMLGGTYAAPSPFSEPLSAGGPAPLAARRRAVTLSTIVLRTFFFAISFLRSARAASVTAGPVKSATTAASAWVRTLLSESSSASTSGGRNGRSEKRWCARRSSHSASSAPSPPELPAPWLCASRPLAMSPASRRK